MAKKRKSTLKSAARESVAQTNPFEQLHSKKRFNTLGRSSKSDKAKARSRHDSVDKVRHVQPTPAQQQALCTSLPVAYAALMDQGLCGRLSEVACLVCCCQEHCICSVSAHTVLGLI